MQISNNNNQKESDNKEQSGKDNEKEREREKKKDKRYHGRALILFILCVIIFAYYTYVYEIIWRNMNHNNLFLMNTLLIIFNILIILLLWCFIITMNTQPGEIPLYWGFYIGDDDYKRKRYCLICNAFKPERSHHCSICNVCVLNMDHHCPWVDNCIGFYNRKYFMQLLFYVCCSTLYFDGSAAYFVYLILEKMINMKILYKDIYHIAIVLIVYCIVLAFSFVITMFFRFHLKLILGNSTTIESLDKEHQAENEKFNVSQWSNWLQVFGSNAWLWFLPLIVEGGRPIGDGLTWLIKEDIHQSIPNDNYSNNPQNRSNQGVVEMNQMPLNANANYASNNINYNSTSPMNPKK